MALRAVAPARTAGMARSVDRGPPCRSAAGDPERLRRGAAPQRAVEPDQRSRRAARRQTLLRAALLRQFRVKPRARPCLGAAPEPAARTEIDPGDRSLWPAHDHSVALPRSAASALRRSLAALLWMSTILSAVVGTIRREPPFDTVLNHWDELWPTRLCAAWSSASSEPLRFEAPTRDPMRLL